MNKGINYFVDQVSEWVGDLGYPLIIWEIRLGTVEVTVRDADGNRVSQHFDHRFISEKGIYTDLARHVVEMIDRRFKEKKYDILIEYKDIFSKRL